MISNDSYIKREVTIGKSKLDFFVDNTYIEVKMPLNTLHVHYGEHVITKRVTSFSSTDRFIKHINELANSLKVNKRAILLTVYQYRRTRIKINQKSTHYDEVKEAMSIAKKTGIETWEIKFCFTHEGVTLNSY